jgi:NAD(P)-dependent dehydrogenase (short-subunit alcohol dehydrogenase family)
VHTYDSPTQVAYCGTKGTISMLGEALGAVIGKHGIRVNVVEPGAVATNMSAGLLDAPDVMKYYLERIALGRVAQTIRARRHHRLPAYRRRQLVPSAMLLVDAGFIVNAEL